MLSPWAVYLPGKRRQQLQRGKHPAWTAWHLQPRIAACRWYRGSFCMRQRKQKKPQIQRGLMRSHLCKIPGPRGKQRRTVTFKGEWHEKASAQKHWLYIAESKLTATLQLINQATFHPDPSPNRCLHAAGARPPQTDRGSSASLKPGTCNWYQQFW